MNDIPPSDNDIQHHYRNSKSVEEFLSTVEEEVKDDIKTIHRYKTDDSELILVGGVHGGNKTIKTVKKAIQKENPDVVGVELGYFQYKLMKWFKSPNTTLEVAAAIFESEKTNSKTIPIDKTRLWMRMYELIHGNRTNKINASIRLFKKLLVILLPILFIISAILFHTIITLILGLLTIIYYAYSITLFRRDPEREFDHALIAIITDVSRQKNEKTIHDEINNYRNAHMSENIKRIQAENRKVVAVVGYNHINGIRKRIDSNDNNWETQNFNEYLQK